MVISRLLRFALLADAVATTLTGLLMFAGSGVLEVWLGLPAPLLRYSGLVLLPYAAIVAYLGTRVQAARWAVWTVIACNAAWAFDSVLLTVSGWIQPTMLGNGFVILQALIVAAFAEFQYRGLRTGTKN